MLQTCPTITSAIDKLQVSQSDRIHLERLLQRRTEHHESELHAAIERGLKLVPSLLRGSVRKLLAS